MQSAELTMIGIYCIILIPSFIGWLFVRRANRKLDEEQEKLLENQAYAKCACGYQELFDRREKTLTHCPKCGAKAVDHKSNISAG